MKPFGAAGVQSEKVNWAIAKNGGEDQVASFILLLSLYGVGEKASAAHDVSIE